MSPLRTQIVRYVSLLLDVILPLSAEERLLRDLSPDYFAASCANGNAEPFPDALAPFSYRHPILKKVLRRLKYHRGTHFAEHLGAALAPYLLEELAERQQYLTFLETIVIPIPLAPGRLQQRGYNQAELIARALIAHFPASPLTLAPHLLVRTKETPSQTVKATYQEREANLKSAFKVTDRRAVRGRDIILLDDIITTGATMTSAKQTLLNAGARRVLCVAVAH